MSAAPNRRVPAAAHPDATGVAARAAGGGAADLLALARAVVRVEAEAVATLEARLDQRFLAAVDALHDCRGKVIVSGVGKSGLIAHKIAATLTSTGTPAVFLHPADALHGDAGLFTPGDVALFVSTSGASDELLALMPYLERHAIALVAIVCRPDSPLGQRADVALVTGPAREACPMDLTPTTSITLAQVMGDCLAIALLERRGFRPEEFRFLHPGGVIGRAAARRVEERMHAGEDVPRVPEHATLREVVLEIMARRLGITTVVDAEGRLTGVISDGDFKRILVRHDDPWALHARDVMTRAPAVIAHDALVAAAVRAMEEHQPGPITALVVPDADGRPVGIIHLHDCLRAG
ncbi:MAG TPA: KpsF/GutQ family sugar-phosphate isomerase [Candidatus Eisenbacteria bacterium]|nr:KpsF/GutQ family sugar-phosphate isomerase [Candidatus Eisenbacteria bacterium]